MSRRPRSFAFVLVWERQQGEDFFWLLDNLKLNGPNWIGGKRDDEDEDWLDVAVREFQEEVGEGEKDLAGWARDAGVALPAVCWNEGDLRQALQSVGAFSLPFYSHNSDDEVQGTGEFFRLEVTALPGLRERLEAGTRFLSPSGRPTVVRFSAAELWSAAWANPDNGLLSIPLREGWLPAPAGALATAFDPGLLALALDRDLATLLLPHLQGGMLAVSIYPDNAPNWSRSVQLGERPMMRIELRWSESDDVFKLDIPMPCNGVWPLSDADGQTTLLIWSPALVHPPGVYALLRYRTTDAKPVRLLRIASTSGRQRDFHFKEGKAPRLGEIKKDLGGKSAGDSLPWPQDKLNSNLPVAFSESLSVLNDARSESAETFANAIHALMTSLEETADESVWVDEMDLKYRRLRHFPLALRENLIAALTNLDAKSGKGMACWEALCNKADNLRVFPQRAWRNRGWMEVLEPINALDALSALRSVRTFAYPGAALERLPPVDRQLHPSYRGLLCPFETPESKRVGITLHLVSGARVDADGCILPPLASPSGLAVSDATALVPFLRHNDAPRAMMGAKNLKQAVAIKGAQLPRVRTGLEDAALHLLAPLATAGWCPSLSRSVLAAPGRDLLVAYLPWEGWNFEDGIVAGEHVRDSGLYEVEEDHTGEFYLQPGSTLSSPPTAEGDAFDHAGLRRPGSLVSRGDALAWVVTESGPGQAVPSGMTGELVALTWLPASDPLFSPCLRWQIRVRRPLAIGDKLMARHGNKGVVARFETVDRMPRLPDDSRLPESLRGRSIDLLLNPNGVISRMNIGQLIEAQFGLALELRGEGSRTVGQRLSDAELAFMQQTFAEHPPFDTWGRIPLDLPGQGTTDCPVTVGFEFFCRLKQFPESKVQARGSHLPQYSYSPLTGQPVAGRRRAGGQRLGEMEIWALAAHQADRVLDGVLHARGGLNNGRYIAESIHDHLFALGYKTTLDGDCFSLQRALPPGSDAPRVSKAADFTPGGNAAKCAKCDFHLDMPDGVGKKGERNDAVRISLAQLLEGFKLAITADDAALGESLLSALAASSGNMPFGVHTFIAPLHDSASGQPRGSMCLNLDFKKGSLSGEVKLPSDIPLPSSLQVWRQTAKDVPSSPEALLVICLKVQITCPKHASAPLQLEGGSVVVKPAVGGVFDPGLFGPEGSRFAWIDYVNNDDVIVSVPVLPSRYRLRALDKKPQREDFLSGCYRKLVIAAQNNDFREAQALHGRINDRLNSRVFGKAGLIRRHGLGRRVDLSARLVIAPDPRLAWDACALPAAVLFTLFADQLRQWPEREEMVAKLAAPSSGLREDNFWRNARFRTTLSSSDTVVLAGVLVAFLAARPKLRVMLNRAPSLHRYSILGFKPKVLAPEDGWVLRINPLVCKPFGADFDGDEMSVHAFLSEAEHQEVAQRLSPIAPENLLSLADGKPLAGFSQDFVLGFFLAGRNAPLRSACLALFPTRCQDILNALPVWDKKAGGILLQHLCTQHADQVSTLVSDWMRFCLALPGKAGISFGFLELLEKRVIPIPVIGEDNAMLEEAANATISALLDDSLDAPGAGFAAIAGSGARGEAEQIRQLLVARGWLSPGALNASQEPTSRFCIPDSLLAGMGEDEAFFSAMNGRSSMMDKKLATPKAGALTRRLVVELWHWRVFNGDCGNRDGLDRCHWIESRKAVCAHCYGMPHGYSVLPDGFPAGLIAAQSFGERGTQLSMQSFHKGASALSIDEVVKIVERSRDRECADFVRMFRKEERFKAYRDLDERHLRMIWLAYRWADSVNPLGHWLAAARPEVLKDQPVSCRLGESPFVDLVCAVWNPARELET